MRTEYIILNGKKYKCSIGTLNMDIDRQQEVLDYMIDKINEGKHEGKVLNLFNFEIGSYKEINN